MWLSSSHVPRAVGSVVLHSLLISAYVIFLFSPFFCFYFASQGHDDAVPCAVLKSVDSFSFLHHPVHQRSLEILQRCKEEKYSKAPHPALLSDTTLTRQEMETRCIQQRKGENTQEAFQDNLLVAKRNSEPIGNY